MVVWIYEKMAEALSLKEYEGARVEFVRLYEALDNYAEAGRSGWKGSKLPVMEIFGPIHQGEEWSLVKTMSRSDGRHDYSCSWCDSALLGIGTGKEDTVQMTADEIWDELKRIGGSGFFPS